MKEINLKIKKNLFIDFSVLFLLVALISLRSVPGIMYIAQVLFLISMTLKIKEDGLYINYYTIFNYLFIIWAISSFFWSIKSQSTIKSLIPLVQITILCIFLAQYYKGDSEAKVDKILKYFCISSVILVIMLVLKTPIHVWADIVRETTNASTSAGRLGYTIGYQPNALGVILSFSALIWLYFISKDKSRFSILMYFILCILVIFTKSRKAIIVLCVGSIMYFIFYKKRNFINMIVVSIIAALIGIICYWSVLNIPFLYKMIGFRMTGLFAAFDSSYVADASVTTRSDMIDVAMSLFKQNPIKGVGIGNFSYYYYYYFGGWAETYSHNNYFEILSNLGIVGFILYYFIPFKLLYVMFIKSNTFMIHNRKLFALIFTMIIIRLVIDYGMVVYDDEFIQFITVVLYCSISCMNSVSKKPNNLNALQKGNKNEFSIGK